MVGTTYILVPGNTITVGGAENTIGGGGVGPASLSTSTIRVDGMMINKAKKIVPQYSIFILVLLVYPLAKTEKPQLSTRIGVP